MVLSIANKKAEDRAAATITAQEKRFLGLDEDRSSPGCGSMYVWFKASLMAKSEDDRRFGCGDLFMVGASS